MIALSYLDDECREHKADPALATALLEAGVDPNEGRTRAGLSALDIVERRAREGPWPEAFRSVESRMVALGATAGVPVRLPSR